MLGGWGYCGLGMDYGDQGSDEELGPQPTTEVHSKSTQQIAGESLVRTL